MATWTKVAPDAPEIPDLDGTSRKGSLRRAPKEVVEKLGIPTFDEKSMDGRVDRQWVFTHPCPAHEVVTLYAYKATSDYGRHSPSPEEFWADETPYPLSIGARTEKAAESFVDWFNSQ